MKPSTLLLGFSVIIAPVILRCPGWSQTPVLAPPLQQKIQAMQEAETQNEQRLHQFQWIETTTVTINGKSRPSTQSSCRYSPYGTLIKTPIGSPPAPPSHSGGPIRERIEEKKIKEAQEELGEIRELASRYLPLNPDALTEAFHNRRVDLETEPAGGDALVINGYVKPGDTLTLELSATTTQIRRIAIRSYFESPSDVMTADVQFSALEDGTTYPSLTTIDYPVKRISISTASSSFAKPVQ